MREIKKGERTEISEGRETNERREIRLCTK